MDIEKIVTELVEKRINDFLSKEVHDAMEYGRGHAVRAFIDEKIKESLHKNSDIIFSAIQESINSVLKKDIVPKIEFSMAFGVSRYEIESMLEKKKKEEAAI